MLNRFVRYKSTSLHQFQKTLLLPKTKFPPRSNLTKTVTQLIPRCSTELYKYQFNEFYEKIESITDPKKKEQFVKDNLWVLQDGPPYANGDLHLGHALNKIIKDIINRYKLSQGKYVYYKPGWDCHGLPIELKALKKVSSDDLESITPTKIRHLARLLADHAILDQKEQFEKFGIMTDWKEYYRTLDSNFEVNQLKVFLKMFQKGLITRKCKPVYWGTETKTALAESELEYNENHRSIAAYVTFPLDSESYSTLFNTLQYLPPNNRNDIKVSLLIWTSTPWTIPSNRAICFNEKLQYSLLCSKGNVNEYVIVMADANVLKDSKFESYSKVLDFEGTKLFGLHYYSPLDSEGSNNMYPLLHGDHITSEMGTGLVHTAPGHGEDDYIVGLQNNLEIFSPIDNEGRYILDKLPQPLKDWLEDPETKIGRPVLDSKTTDSVLKMLDNFKMLFQSHDYSHSYPYDWRSKKPVIIRSTPQWFTNLVNIKPDALESLDSIEFHPKRGKTRLSSFIKNRNEWCISRQRYWGVPIPAFYSKENSDHILMDEEIILHVISVIEKFGINTWFRHPDMNMELWLPPKYKDVSKNYYRGTETMDVWFDSGTVWCEMRDFYLKKLKLPSVPKTLSDMCVEGSDQHRGWFQSLLLTSISANGSNILPYKSILTHGFTLDEKGRKMSKSIGNVITPKAFIKGDETAGIIPLGVDGLRYLIAQSNFTTDIVSGPETVKHVSDALKKIRLLFRFVLGNLQHGSITDLHPSELRDIDIYVISTLNKLAKKTKKEYDCYNFSKVLTEVQHHITNTLSSLYFDVSKDSLYCDSVNSLKRQQIQYVLLYCLKVYCPILVPIIPNLIQEVFDYIPATFKFKNKENSLLHNIRWPRLQEVDEKRAKLFLQNILPIVQQFKGQFTSLEINKPGQVQLSLYTNVETLPFEPSTITDITQTSDTKFFFNTNLSEIDTKDIDIGNNKHIKLVLEQSTGHTCPRCWKSTSKVEEKLCRRCEDATHNI